MIWLFELSVGLLVVAVLMSPLCKLFAPAWAGKEPRRTKRPPAVDRSSFKARAAEI